MKSPREFLKIRFNGAEVSFVGWLGMLAFLVVLSFATGSALLWLAGYVTLPAA